ncbi:MAG: anti-sigma factor [Xanthobacteraceae bacterium]|nr:anti-sigma factor [Xanthobacteraceae bacterium]
MTDINIPVTEDELHAYVDGELPPDRRAAVEAWLVAHPDAAAQVASWRAMSELLHAKYDSVADEPVPKRLDVERLGFTPRKWMYGAIAATLAAFLIGGGAGYVARGAGAQPTTFASFTGDALDAHRLYVVDVRHPVEVTADQRAHLQQWLTNRCGYQVRAPELDDTGLKLVGGRLLPGPSAPAAFLMYETASGERYTIYAARDRVETTQMRFAAEGSNGALYWADKGVGYVVTGPADKDKLTQVARLVYDQVDKTGL